MSTELNHFLKPVGDTLENFTKIADEITESLAEGQRKQNEEYIEKTHVLLEEAQILSVKIQTKLMTGMDSPSGTPTEVKCAQVELPAIPIPMFSGKLIEFENFWALFSANVHNQKLSNLQKFNYLLQSLKGEAKVAIKRYSVTEENYTAAVEMLHSKFGDKSKLIRELEVRLERTTANGTHISEQRRLLAYLLALTTQLEQKGVSLNGSFITQRVLAKFKQSLQRKVLQLHVDTNKEEEDWSVNRFLIDLDRIITAEEKVNDMLASNEALQNRSKPTFGRRQPEKLPDRPFSCLYCNAADHFSQACTKIASIEERTKFLMKNKMCLNCAKPNHLLKVCFSKGCNMCENKKHHSTICPKRHIKGKFVTQTKGDSIESTNHATHTKQDLRKSIQNQNHTTGTRKITSTNLQFTEENSNKDAATTMRISSTERLKNVDEVLLLTGMAKICDRSGQLKEAEILFDTGAGAGASVTSQNCKFEMPKESSISCRCARSTSSRRMLDRSFFRQKTERQKQKQGITLSKNTEKPTSPQILLRCDQLWPLLNSTEPQHVLPSGLFVILSKCGYLLSGKKEIRRNETANFAKHGDNGDNHHIMQIDTLDAKEVEKWDRYWSLDTCGIEEFTGTKNAEKAQINDKIQKFFNDTVEKRNDGYYVRLPFKDSYKTLPTNKAIAYSRLMSVLNSLQKNPQLLQQYHDVFQEQLAKGIIEEVDEEGDSQLVHYLPHQPVITPSKQTTKLRVVFDASSHYKGEPSLNDTLHQGPLILPELYGMLLRFRMKKFVVTADVEKAFLQVRLNENDRDVTRCLWVKNTDSPPIGSNIVTYRFTRVTFGLNASPFLLAATIRHHINNEVEDSTLASEINKNLYVDNLILSGDTTDEVVEKSLKVREIFQQMNMNLREFLANDAKIQEKLPYDNQEANNGRNHDNQEKNNERNHDNQEANNERNHDNKELDENEILIEIDDLEKELEEVHSRIRDLLRMRTCQPRLFEAGVTREKERTMPCSFCYVQGHHYSDSCTKITGAKERETHLKDRGRCTICLQLDCQKGFYCKKYSIQCHHCKKTGHASAICKLPEQSIEIFAERNDLENIADRLLKRLEELRRRV